MGKLIKHEMYIDTLNRKRDVYVYLPCEYEDNKDLYDVVYMHDAQNVFFAEKSYSGASWGVLENFNNKNQKQCIFVCVDHGDEHRISEYGVLEHSEASKKFIEEGTIPSDIQGDLYVKWLVDTLMPFINKNYRVKEKRENTAIMGSSMGGLISLYAVSKYPKAFGNVGILSPAFWFCSEKLYEFVKKSDFDGKIYMSVGTNESGIEKASAYINDATKMAGILAFKGDFVYRVVKDGIHNEKDWAILMPEIIDYFLK